MVSLQTFAYRNPRVALQLPLSFQTEGFSILGETLNLSETGLYARLEQPVLTGTRGRLRLVVESCSVEIDAEVLHAELWNVRFCFSFASEAEHNFIATLVKVMSRTLRQPAAFH